MKAPSGGGGGGGGGGTHVDADEPVSSSIDKLLSSLLTSISLNNYFRAKCSLLRSKLTHLHSLLSDLPSSNPLSLDLLRSLFHTLSDALSLAHRCQGPSLSAGKLKTQSELDSLLTRLDRHIRDANVLIRIESHHAPVIAPSNSYPPSSRTSANTSTSTKRDGVRAESIHLVIRLQIGGPDSKNSTMDSLLGLLREDDKNVAIAVAHGLVPVLVELLDSGSPTELKEKTLAAISRVSTVESCKQMLVAQGLLLLNHLLRVLESGSGFAREKACIVLQALSFSKENARVIGCRGGISSLLDLCASGTPTARALAAGVLRNLAVFPEIRVNFIEENAVAVLVGLAASGTALAKKNAFGCLCSLVSDHDEVNLKLLVVKEKGIECLKDFFSGIRTLPHSSLDLRGLQVAAMELLTQLVMHQPIGEVVVSNGFIPHLCSALRLAGVRAAAARCIYELAALTPRTKKEIGGECGCMGVLAEMLDSKCVNEREAAAMALSSLLQYAGNQRTLVEELGGRAGSVREVVASAVKLLDPSILNLDKRYPIALLASLATHSSKWRKQMVLSGACEYLQKLDDMGIESEGAKKLRGSINPGTGRRRIWSWTVL